MANYSPTDHMLLSHLGYLFLPSPGDTKGDLERLTQEAVKQFQSTHEDQGGRPLPVTGAIDDETRAAMLRVVLGKIRSTRLGTQIVQIALREAASRVREKGDNRGPGVEKYQAVTDYSVLGERTGFPWCASFVSWVYEQVGIPLRFAKVKYLSDWAKEKGTWVPNAPGIIPPRGSIFVNRAQKHTGIVVYGDDAHVYTVEGNTSSGMKGSQTDGDGLYQRSRGYSWIGGYIVVPELVSGTPIR